MRITKIIRRRISNMALLFAALSFSACGKNDPVSDNGDEDKTPPAEVTHLIPQELETIPEAYYQAANQRGTLVEFTYETYESMTYEQKTRKLTKRAIVYLPYAYSNENRYNAFYLMHGGWGNETSTLGTPGQPSVFKNILDNAIENGRMHPLIIICPTYNNTSGYAGFGMKMNN